MSSSRPATGHGVQPATVPGQVSLRQGALPALPALPRARAVLRPAPMARRCPVGRDMADALRAIWPGLMLRKFRSDAECAAVFGRERQTGSNWRNGDCGPDAGATAQAFLTWPDELPALVEAEAARMAGRSGWVR